MPTPSPILDAQGLQLDTPPLGPLDLTIHPFQVTILAGASGGGKSRLLRALADLDPPAGGTITLADRSSDGYTASAFRRQVAYLPSSPALGDGTVGELLAQVARLRTRADAEPPEPLLRRLDLDPEALTRRPVDDLSSGETVRVALALLLAGRPRCLLLDEPTGPLDPASQQAAETAIAEAAKAGAGVLWVTHDPDQVARMADARWHLRQGRLETDHAG